MSNTTDITLLFFIECIFIEGMIVVSDSAKKKMKSRCLAETPERERAYYVDPRDMKEFGIEFDESKTSGVAPSGSEWYPSILDSGRLTVFIPGNPGAGKSYLAAELIETLPDSYDILLFTALEEEDGNFSSFKKRLYKIKMTEENLARMTLSEIRRVSRHPVLLFDDIDKIRDKKVEKKVFEILEDALANGRGHVKHDGQGDVHVIVTSHSLNDYRKTKYTLENSDYVALFPGSTTYAQLTRLFEKMGLGKDLCDFVYEKGKKCALRRVIVKKVAPMYIIIGDTITLI